MNPLESLEARELRETPSLQAGPRSEELAGEASRASIASVINTAHVTTASQEAEQVIRSSFWALSSSNN